MELDRKELKARARERIGSAVPAFWTVMLIYFLLTTGVSLAVDLASSLLDSPSLGAFSSLALFLSLLVSLYSVVVRFGLRLWSLWTWRKLDSGPGALVQGFSVAGRVLWMEVQIVLRLIPWVFLISFLASLVLLLLTAFSDFFLPGGLALAILAAAAGMWCIMLRYALAPYLLADRPDDGAGAAVRRSAGLMRGWIWELFKLEFSFLGWEALNVLFSAAVLAAFLFFTGSFQSVPDPEQLLRAIQSAAYEPAVQALTAVVTLPVFLWLTPYRETARAGFYDARLQLYREELPDMPPL